MSTNQISSTQWGEHILEQISKMKDPSKEGIEDYRLRSRFFKHQHKLCGAILSRVYPGFMANPEMANKILDMMAMIIDLSVGFTDDMYVEKVMSPRTLMGEYKILLQRRPRIYLTIAADDMADLVSSRMDYRKSMLFLEKTINNSGFLYYE